jgi:hypothetical protein
MDTRKLGVLMYRVPSLAMVPIVATTTAGFAQTAHDVKLAEVAAVWDYEASVGPAGVVVVASVLTMTADGKACTIRHANDPPIPVRVGVVAGDSVVFEAGPYASTARPGETVVRLHVVLHRHGDMMTGAFEARYASGEIAGGTADATRRK